MSETVSEKFLKEINGILDKYPEYGHFVLAEQDDEAGSEEFATARKRCVKWGIDPRTGRRVCLKWVGD